MDYLLRGSNNKILFPKIVVTKNDNYLSRLILVEYAGCESELSSVSDYLYQSILFKESYPKISKAFEQIAEEEASHFKALGKIITSLGDYPTVNINARNKIKYENRKNIPYKKIISDNILKENETIDNYKKIIKYTDNESILKTINIIISAERRHAKINELAYKDI